MASAYVREAATTPKVQIMLMLVTVYRLRNTTSTTATQGVHVPSDPFTMLNVLVQYFMLQRQ